MTESTQKLWNGAIPEIAYRAQDFEDGSSSVLKNFLDPSSHRIAWNYMPSQELRDHLAAIKRDEYCEEIYRAHYEEYPPHLDVLGEHRYPPYERARSKISLINEQEIEVELDPEIERNEGRPLLKHLKYIADEFICVIGKDYTVRFDNLPDFRFMTRTEANLKTWRSRAGAFSKRFHMDGPGAGPPPGTFKSFTMLNNLIGARSKFVRAYHYAATIQEAHRLMVSSPQAQKKDADLYPLVWLDDAVKALVAEEKNKGCSSKNIISEASCCQLNIFSRRKNMDSYKDEVIGIHKAPDTLPSKRLLVVWSGHLIFN